MKLAILALLVASAYCGVQYRPYQSTQFNSAPDREFVYNYEGQVLTGIPQASKLHSGLKIRSIVRVQPLSGDRFAFVMERPTVGKVVRQLEWYDRPLVQLSMEKFQPLSSDEQQTIIPQLEKPIIFQWRNGMVSTIESSVEEPEWSVNIKRGVLKMLSINMHPSSVESYDNQLQSEQSSEQPRVYSTFENGVGGECEMIYTVGPQQSQQEYSVSSSQSLHIVKVHNFENCRKTPSRSYGNIHGKKCRDCAETEHKLLKPMAQCVYNVSSGASGFVIESVESDAQYVFTPYSKNAGHVLTATKQSMRLVEKKSVSTPISVPSQVKSGSLNFTFEHEHVIQMFNQRYTPNSLRGEELVRATEQMFRVLAEQIETDPEHVADMHQHLILYLLALTDEDHVRLYESLRSIIESRQTDSINRRIRHLYLDHIATLPTTGAIKLVSKLIKERTVGTPRSMVMLKTLGLFMSRNESELKGENIEILDTVLDLCKSQRAQEKKSIRNTCWLTFGTVLNKLCQTTVKQDTPFTGKQRGYSIYTTEYLQRLQIEKSICPSHKLEQYLTNLVANVESRSTEEQMVCLKSIGNAGLISSIEHLQRIISQQSLKPEVRSQAIYSLRKLTREIPQRVIKLLLPVYYDQQESYEVRIAAFAMIMKAKPSTPIVHSIAAQLRNETSRQVGTFTYTYLRSLANSTHPCLRQLSCDAKHSLEFASKFQRKPWLSQGYHFDRFSQKLEHGAILELASLGSEHTYLPKQFVAGLKGHALGFESALGQMGVRVNGMQKMIEKWLRRMLPKYEQMLTPELKATLEQLQFVPRSSYEKPDVSAYLRLFGYDISYFKIDGQTMRDIISRFPLSKVLNRLSNGIKFDYTKTLPLSYAFKTFPTELGVPIELFTLNTFLFKNSGEMRWDRSSKRAEIQSRPYALINMDHSMSVQLGNVLSGMRVHKQIKAQLPIRAQVTYDRQSKSVSAEFMPSQSEKELLKLSSKPSAFVITMPYTNGYGIKAGVMKINHPEIIEKVISGEESGAVKSYRKVFGKNSLGFEVEVTGKRVQGRTAKSVPRFPMSGVGSLSVRVRPGVQAPRSVKVSLTYSRGQPSFNVQQNSQWPSWESSQSSSKSSIQGLRREVSTHTQISSLIDRLVSDSRRKSASSSLWSSSSSSDQSFTPTHYVKMTIQSTGSVERSVSVVGQLQWRNQQSKLYPKVHVELERSPLPTRQQKFYAMMCGELRLPQLSSQQYEKSVVGLTSLKWGPQEQTAQSDRHITIKAVAKNIEKHYQQSNPELQKMTSQCQRDQTEGRKSSWACERVPMLESKIEEVLVEVSHNRVPYMLKNILHKFNAFTKHRFYNKMSTKPMPEPKPEVMSQEEYRQIVPFKTFYIRARVQPNSRYVNFTLQTPFEQTNFTRLRLPYKVRTPSMYKHVRQQIPLLSRRSYSHKCITEKNHIVTFDKHTVDTTGMTPDSWHVLVKDTRHQTFVVMFKKMYHGMMSMKIVTSQKELELFPESSHMTFKVNGQMVPFDRYYEIKDFNGKVFATVHKTGSGMTVFIKKIGVEIFNNGFEQTVQITRPYFFHNALSGLCGNMNDQLSDETQGPDLRQWLEPRQLLYSYSLSQEDRSRLQSSERQSERKITKVLYNENIDSVRSICFSTEPLTECNSQISSPASYVKKSVRFTCLPEKSSETQQLLKIVSQGTPLYNLRDSRVQKVAKLSVPSECVEKSRSSALF